MFFDLNIRRDNNNKTILFNNETNHFFLESGEPLNKNTTLYSKYSPYWRVEPVSIKVLSILLGYKCNYKCSYCKQATLRENSPVEEFMPCNVDSFMDKISALALKPELIILYGGEPLVYWKTLVKLIPKLRQAYPQAVINFPTNGSLLSREKIEFFNQYDVGFSLSYDGEGGGRTRSCLRNKRVISALQQIKDGVGIRVTWNKNSVPLDRIKEDFAKHKIIINSIRIDGVAQPGITAGIDPEDFLLPNEIKQEITTQVLKIYESNDIMTMRFDKLKKTVEMFANGIGIDALALNQCKIINGSGLYLDCEGNIHNCMESTEILGNIQNIGNSEPIDISQQYQNHLYKNKCFTCPLVTACDGVCPRIHDEKSREFEIYCDNKKTFALPLFRMAIEKLFNCKLIKIKDHETKRTLMQFPS